MANKKVVTWFYYNGGFWIRIFGYGISIIDKNKHRPLFSERNGLRKVFRIGRWGIGLLNDNSRSRVT